MKAKKEVKCKAFEDVEKMSKAFSAHCLFCETCASKAIEKSISMMNTMAHAHGKYHAKDQQHPEEIEEERNYVG